MVSARIHGLAVLVELAEFSAHAGAARTALVELQRHLYRRGVHPRAAVGDLRLPLRAHDWPGRDREWRGWFHLCVLGIFRIAIARRANRNPRSLRIASRPALDHPSP